MQRDALPRGAGHHNTPNTIAVIPSTANAIPTPPAPQRAAALLAFVVEVGVLVADDDDDDDDDVVVPSFTGVKVPLVPLARVYCPVL